MVPDDISVLDPFHEVSFLKREVSATPIETLFDLFDSVRTVVSLAPALVDDSKRSFAKPPLEDIAPYDSISRAGWCEAVLSP